MLLFSIFVAYLAQRTTQHTFVQKFNILRSRSNAQFSGAPKNKNAMRIEEE